MRIRKSLSCHKNTKCVTWPIFATKHPTMHIRKAQNQDAKAIATYIVLAMDDLIYNILGNITETEAILFMSELVATPGNQYSYDNAWVMEDKNAQIVAAAVVYDGARLEELRQTVIRKIAETFQRHFQPEAETQAGEFYIDTVGVNPDVQGKGYGSTLFQFLIDEYVHRQKQTLGLLVDKDNPKAKALYLRLGFQYVKDVMFVGKTLEHLQYQSS